MPRREKSLVLPSRWLLALVCWLVLIGACRAQNDPAVASASGVAERAFPFKALPVDVWVQRGSERLPVGRVPRLRVGDTVRLSVDLEAPELTSQSGAEQQRLRDWSIGWFLTTPEGSLVFDSTRPGKTDRGRIDLERGEREIAIKVEHERQTFPIFFFVRTRTLESWEEIRATRQTKASNFVDHFGRYSDVVGDYEGLQAFLKALQREQPQAETMEERLVTGFEELGFTVDSKMRLNDPQVVAKLLGELETSLGTQSKTFKAEVAGKVLSQMIGDSDLGLIGAAMTIGGVLYRVTDYSESYHWSSARLKEENPGRYWVMSAERLRHGEDEKAADGTARANVRSILVATPMSTEAPRTPTFAWQSDARNSLIPGGDGAPEVLTSSDKLISKTHPALVERFFSPEATVWDSLHGDKSPLKATVTSGGSLEVSGFDQLWRENELQAQVKVAGKWGFDTVSLADFTALRATPEGALKLPRAPYLLSQGQRYRLDLESDHPVALGKARFAGREVKIEKDSDGKTQVVLEGAKAPAGVSKLEIFAGQGTGPANLILSQEFWVVSSSNFHVLLPEGSTTCELVVAQPDLVKALSDVSQIKISDSLWDREGESLTFRTSQPPAASTLKGTRAELLFEEHGSVPGVHLELAEKPSRVNLQVFSRARDGAGAYTIELDSSESRLLASGAPTEFRLRSAGPWPGNTELTLELVGPAGQVVTQQYVSQPKADQALVRIKGELLFGDFTPRGTGELRCRLRSPIEGSRLPLEWTLETPWRVIDVPQLQDCRWEKGALILQGEDLDITIARVFGSEDPAQDPDGSPLQRLPDGNYQAELPEFDLSQLWLELVDLQGESKRIRAVRRP